LTKRGAHFWAIQIPGWLLLLYLLYGQAIAAFDYQLAIAMGTQESAAQITEVGVAFFWGFAFGDLVTYIPLLAAGLVGHWLAKRWGDLMLAAALGITLYWPVVSLATVVATKGIEGFQLSAEREYWVVLPTITLWAAYGLWHIIRSQPHQK